MPFGGDFDYGPSVGGAGNIGVGTDRGEDYSVEQFVPGGTGNPSYEAALNDLMDTSGGETLGSFFGYQSDLGLTQNPAGQWAVENAMDLLDSPALQMALGAANPLMGGAYALARGIHRDKPLSGVLGAVAPVSPVLGVPAYVNAVSDFRGGTTIDDLLAPAVDNSMSVQPSVQPTQSVTFGEPPIDNRGEDFRYLPPAPAVSPTPQPRPAIANQLAPSLSQPAYTPPPRQQNPMDQEMRRIELANILSRFRQGRFNQV